MKFNVYLLLILVFLNVNLDYAQEPTWVQNIKKIVPLKSNRSDVIKLFGMPSESSDPYSPRYLMKEGKFSYFKRNY